MKTVITISRQLGSQGSYIAAAVAQKLNFRYLDREILHRAAETVGHPDAEMVAHLENREVVPGFWGRLWATLQNTATVPVEPSATQREIYVYNELAAMMMQAEGISREEAMARTLAREERIEKAASYAELVRQVILEFADAGKAVIVGRGGQVILRDRNDVLRVRIVASEAVRVQRVMERQLVSYQEAARLVRQNDRERARYLKHFYGVDWHDPTLYDLILNTDKLTVDKAVDLIMLATQA